MYLPQGSERNNTKENELTIPFHNFRNKISNENNVCFCQFASAMEVAV